MAKLIEMDEEVIISKQMKEQTGPIIFIMGRNIVIAFTAIVLTDSSWV